MYREPKYFIEIIHEHELIFEYLSGDCTVEFVVQCYYEKAKQCESCLHYSSVVDVSQATFHSNLEHLRAELLTAKELLEVKSPKKYAMLAADPNQTATTMMYVKFRQQLISDPAEVFSSLEGALAWMGKYGDAVADLKSRHQSFIVRSKNLEAPITILD